ncbi:Flagellar WD repeat-containing protein Pf20,Sperm-associated antigen 16 protein [Acanthosepion pharaonis]|uniref:Flagellar WD repeat-containing protein Pf20,Sperm-associated antigen 16 protein n=1 Tax=Acanthosepion pharaonis TaxID=158019 RepID=A0A812CTU2_ACAPH|nr:Flagellar WD repeat-containing protein Pf20,Sperm-associated antigen 16 protein [Sepia pharaonis]
MAEIDPNEEKYYLETEVLSDTLDDDYEYEIVSGDEDVVSADLTEDLDCAVRCLQEVESREKSELESKEESPKPSVSEIPEPVEDFIGNFLVRMGMKKSLNHFLTEWYELEEKGLVEKGKVGMVPDVYRKIIELEDQLKIAEKESLKYKNAAFKAKDTYVKLRKQRDFHRMNHRRVIQEKNKLITDIKRLRSHYSQYEPTLHQFRIKYEIAMKQKMLTKIELERSQEHCTGLINMIKNLDLANDNATGSQDMIQTNRICGKGRVKLDSEGLGPTQRALASEREKVKKSPSTVSTKSKRDSKFPFDTRENPYLPPTKGLPSHTIRTGGFKLTKTILVHKCPVSSLCLHPKKQIMATTSDDMSWKLWSVPAGDLIGLCGQTFYGHEHSVNNARINNKGDTVASCDALGTVKIWDTRKVATMFSFEVGNFSVNKVSFDPTSSVLAMACDDHTVKIYDIANGQLSSLIGHEDAVQCMAFDHHGQFLISGGSDNTMRIWS